MGFYFESKKNPMIFKTLLVQNIYIYIYIYINIDIFKEIPTW